MQGEYLKYTGLFLLIMLATYFFIMLSGIAQTPTFTYAEF